MKSRTRKGSIEVTPGQDGEDPASGVDELRRLPQQVLRAELPLTDVLGVELLRWQVLDLGVLVAPVEEDLHRQGDHGQRQTEEGGDENSSCREKNKWSFNKTDTILFETPTFFVCELSFR